jgi:SAM-dependent methyltransferase
MINISEVYDELAPEYDERYSGPDELYENSVVADWIFNPILPELNILDVGCGTGLLIDLLGFAIPPENYTGVDPSAKMLTRFATKHLQFRTRLHCRPVEEFRPAESYDLVVGLFGAPSYVEPRTIARLPYWLAQDGAGFLMLYKPGYLPDYYDEAPPTVDTSRAAAESLPGAVSSVWRNFTLVSFGSRDA